MFMFLIRAFFWIGLFIVILPVEQSASGPRALPLVEQQTEQASHNPLSYVLEFCLNNPHWCEKAHNAGVRFYADLTSIVQVVQAHFADNQGTSADQ